MNKNNNFNKSDIIGLVVVVLCLLTVIVVFWNCSNKSMREYDNKAQACTSFASRGGIDNADYPYFMINCLQVK